ncbi:unnamed protein product [Clonostachys chloroleuca]|uniref:Uncharacterized protein n=1 Tax=Clonostachys chloroleuca TaxID=1926264 RepID=A0AA35Q0U6_9HYPO|nr:unnamed protein product [Clonostachys chloroleuca]
MRLHKAYGDIVRVGPSELSINDPTLFHSIHSNSSTFTKGPWYNLMHPVVSLHMIRDHEEHTLREYEPRVALYTEQLLKRIVCNGNQTVNVTALFNYYSFDVMGDLAFGRSFNMLRDGAAHKYMKSSHDNMLTATAFSHLVWTFPIVKKIPGLNYGHIQLQKWLTEQNLDHPTPQDEVNLVWDAHLVVVAGSDLTAASITCLFYQLALHPRIMADLQIEIDRFYTEYEQPNHHGLSKLEYLNACIDESLRLYPPVPSGLQRIGSPQGCHIGDLFIPGNTVVQIPAYTMYRDAKNVTLPDDFIPERWTTRPELTRDSSIYAPFSIGSYSCAGKQLGLMELRFVTSQILGHFNVSLPNDFDPKQFSDGVKDGLTIVTTDLNLVFTRRDC